MLPRVEIVEGMSRELEDFEQLVRSLDASEWNEASRCAGWTVADVAGHLVGAFADILAGRVDGQGTPEVSERQAAERRGRTAEEIADELDVVRRGAAKMLAAFGDDVWSAVAPGGSGLTVGRAMASLWCGTYVHGDDIRAAVGRPSQRGPGLRGAVHFVAGELTEKGWGPAVLALDGLEEVAVGRATGATHITGDPLAFVLVATGRADPAALGLDATVNVYGA